MSKLYCAILLMICVSCGEQAYSQQTNKIEPNHAVKNTYSPKLISVHLLPIGLIDLVEPNITVGGEYRIKKKRSVLVDVGYVYKNMDGNINPTWKKFNGFIFKPTYRIYTRNGYFDVNTMVKYRQVTKEDWVDYLGDDQTILYHKNEIYSLYKLSVGVNAVLGLKTRLSDKIFLDLYCGFGMRYNFSGIINKKSNVHYFDFDLNRRVFIPYFTNGITPNLTAGIRLGYKL